MSDFVKIFNELLKSKSLNLRELETKINISSSQLSKYANGNYEPSLKNIINICNFFECSLDYIMGLDKIPNRFGNLQKKNVVLFNERFYFLLSLNNTNINKVSKNTYINRNCIYHWKNSNIFPKVSILAKLSHELNTNIEFLIGRTTIKEPIYEFWCVF